MREQLLAHQLRNAKANGLLVAFEEELRHIAAVVVQHTQVRHPHVMSLPVVCMTLTQERPKVAEKV